MTKWIEDKAGNKCSIEYFGSKKAAQKALDSLVNCRDCVNCSDCYHCSRYFDKNKPIEVPQIENIHQTVYKAASQPGCLDMETWHRCETTHCRAGWVTTLAGPKGAELERKLGPVVAAMKIYDASSDLEAIDPASFFVDDKTALADMKRLAQLEAFIQKGHKKAPAISRG